MNPVATIFFLLSSVIADPITSFISNDLNITYDLTQLLNSTFAELLRRYDHRTLNLSYNTWTFDEETTTVNPKLVCANGVTFSEINIPRIVPFPPTVRCTPDKFVIEFIVEKTTSIKAKGDFHFRLSSALPSCSGVFDFDFHGMNITLMKGSGVKNPDEMKIEFDTRYGSLIYDFFKYEKCGHGKKELVLNQLVSSTLDRIEEGVSKILQPVLSVLSPNSCPRTTTNSTKAEQLSYHKLVMDPGILHWKMISFGKMNIVDILQHLRHIKCTFNEEQKITIVVDKQTQIKTSAEFQLGPFEGFSSCTGSFDFQFQGMNITLVQPLNSSTITLDKSQFDIRYGIFTYDFHKTNGCRYRKSSLINELVSRTLDEIKEQISHIMRPMLYSTNEICQQPFRNIIQLHPDFLDDQPMYFYNSLSYLNPSSPGHLQLVIKGLPRLKSIDIQYSPNTNGQYNILFKQIRARISASNDTGIHNELHFKANRFFITGKINDDQLKTTLHGCSIFLTISRNIQPTEIFASDDLVRKLEDFLTQSFRREFSNQHNPDTQVTNLIADLLKSS